MTWRGFGVVVLFVLALWSANTWLSTSAQEWLVLLVPVLVIGAIVVVVAVRYRRGS